MIGRTIGKYRILEKLGRGGMGTVYKALDETLSREVAVKVLNPDITDTDVMRRFQAEARALAKLNHPEIATIHEIHNSDTDLLMVMEFVRGETLEQLLARSGPLPPERAAYLVAQILGALVHAHQAGVVHRDLKPSNVMVTEHGGVKIMDFGIARVAGAEHMTAVGLMVGTPAYMSPERILGNEVDGRADLYSVGVLFYRLLTGQLPFKATDPTDMVQKQLSEPPTPVRRDRPDLPVWCEEMLTHALAKSPADRYQTAEEFRTGLLSAITNAAEEQTGKYQQPETTSAWNSVSPDALTIATATPPLGTGAPFSRRRTAETTAADVTTAGSMPPSPETSAMASAMSAATSAATATPPSPAAIPEVPPEPAPTLVDVKPTVSTNSLTPRPSPSPVFATSARGAVPSSPSPRPAAPHTNPQASAPSAATLVMKKNQFALAGVLLAALALGVVVLGIVVFRKSSSAEVAPQNASAMPSPATTSAPAPPPIAPAATAPPVELSDPAPIPVGVSPPPPAPPPSSSSGTANASKPKDSVSSTTSAPAAPSPPAVPTTTVDGKPLVTAPFKFDAKAIVVEGDKGRERDADVLVADGKVTVTEGNEKVLYVVSVSALTALTYSSSKQPLWNSPNGPAEAMKVESGAFGFLKGGRNWVSLRTSDSLLVLRVDDGMVRRVITGLQERTGLTVARLVEPKE